MVVKSFALNRNCYRHGAKVKRFHSSSALFWHNWILAVSVLLLFGTLCRLVRSRLNLVDNAPMLLPVALSVFPSEVKDWTGTDVQIPKYIQKIAANDDFLYRIFTNKLSNQWVNLYIAYSGRPGTMLGHRPETCYTADGWVHETTEQSQFKDAAGRLVPCSIHRFYKPQDNFEMIVVLNFYVLNGKIVDGEKDFSGLGWRTPNLDGNPARYVAQVQISSVFENAVRNAARDLTPEVLGFFPDKNGKVNMTDYIKLAGDNLN